MLMVPAGHSFDFMRENNLWVEAHITRTDKREDFQDYEPFIRSIHLPYSGINLAAYDEEVRRASINKVKSAVNKGAQYPVDRMVLHPCAVYSLAGDDNSDGYHPFKRSALRLLSRNTVRLSH